MAAGAAARRKCEATARLKRARPPGKIRGRSSVDLARGAAPERIKRCGQSVAGRITVFRFFREAAHNDVVEARRQRRIAAGWLDWIGRQDLRTDGGNGAAVKWRHPGQHLVQNDAQGEQVGAGAMRLAHDLLGSQIGGSAHNPPRAGKLGGKARDTEVAELYLAFFGDHDVGRLDVAVNDAGVVGAAQSGGQIGSPGTSARPGNGRFGKHLLQSATVHILHHQVGDAGFFDADVEQVDDGGVGELPDDLRFAQELLLLWSGPKGVNKRFDGYRAANDFVAGFVDATGGAETQWAEDLVAIFLHG